MSQYNDYGYEMVRSYEDLLGRLVVASELKASDYNEPEDACMLMGVPIPSKATICS